MQVTIIKDCGFCFGVRRAMELAEAAANRFGFIETLGELIHNPQELARIRSRICTKHSLDEISGKAVLIRSHGIAPEIIQEAAVRNIEVIDATCPFVKRAQEIARQTTEDGYQLIIVGDAAHPEVIGIKAWANHSALVVANVKQALALPSFDKAAVLAQTTQTMEVFEACCKIIAEKAQDFLCFNTICNHTAKIQQRTASLAQQVDAMIVVGGKNSANTIKLAQVSKGAAIPVFHIESADELDCEILGSFGSIGITAGASTPQHIIEEVANRMSEFEKLEVEEVQVAAEATENAMTEQEKSDAEAFAEEFGNMKEIRRGARVKGVVVQVKDDELLVDIGGKSEGVLSSAELSQEDAKNIRENFHVGDEIDVLILRKENQEGYPVLSKRRVDQDIAWDKLAQMKADKEIVTGTVTDVVKGGVLVDVGLRGFVPASLLALGYVEDLNAYVGKELQMKIIECDKHSNKLVLSAKAVLRSASKAQKEKTWAEIEEGQTRHGVVRRLTNFGAFVDIGGVDGLLHVSEMAWYRVNHPSDLLKEGDELDVYILGIDQENEKISLGLKQLVPNPWSLVEEKYPVGSIITAKVMRTTTFGAFLEVEPGVEGLVHISQLAHHRVEKTEDVVKPGDIVKVKVLAIDPEAKRMSLSIKAAVEPEENEVTTEHIDTTEE